MPGNTDSSHDGAYKLLFSHPEMVEGLLKDFVSEDWVRELDFSTLEHCPGSYVSDDLRQREDDIIWRIQWRGAWCYVCLLIEFQSQVDPWMALRVMVYTGLLYQDLIRNKVIKRGDQLPPVFPLVLYNGLAPWTAKRDIGELIAPMPASLEHYKPSQRYYLLDESSVPDDELARAQSLTAALLRFERVDSPKSLQLAIKGLIIKLKEPRFASLRRAFSVWISRVLLKRAAPQHSVPELHDLQEVNAMLAEKVTLWAEQWKKEGLEAGLQQGLEQGLERGQGEGRMALLARLLRKRFGDDALERVQPLLQGASLEQLDLWAERILDAASIDDVFGEQAQRGEG